MEEGACHQRCCHSAQVLGSRIVNNTCWEILFSGYQCESRKLAKTKNKCEGKKQGYNM